MRHKVHIKRIEPKRRGRPPSGTPMGLVRDLRTSGASIRQVRDTLRLSHGTAQRAVSVVDAEIGMSADNDGLDVTRLTS